MDDEKKLAAAILTHEYWAQQARGVIEQKMDIEEIALNLGVLIADLVVKELLKTSDVRDRLNDYNDLAREMVRDGGIDSATQLAHHSLAEACKRTRRSRINDHRVDLKRRRNTLPH